MFLWLKRLSGSMSDGQWFSGRPTVVDLDVDRDWSDMERLIATDGLHHTRADVEGWLAVDGAVGLVARKDDRFAGFMVTHPVGSVGHVDLVSVDPQLRKSSIARPLYFRGVNAMKVAGCKGFVAHAHPRSRRPAPGAGLQSRLPVRPSRARGRRSDGLRRPSRRARRRRGPAVRGCRGPGRPGVRDRAQGLAEAPARSGRHRRARVPQEG